MDAFEKQIIRKAKQFERDLHKQSPFQQWSKGIQQKLDGIIPDQVHHSFAVALEKSMKAFLQGIHAYEQSRPKPEIDHVTLAERSQHAQRIAQDYKKLASIEGGGTGFGGIVASAIDFPALISIKLKMLQELSVLFGYSLDDVEERVFILKLFQLQFSGQLCKQRIWAEVSDWEAYVEQREWSGRIDVDWDEFYMEYKQSIELPKLLQIIPGFGAIVGFWANASFLNGLGETVILCYQLRHLQEKYGERML